MPTPVRPLDKAAAAQQSRKLAQLCAELGRFVAGAPDTCVLAWDNGEAPTLVAVAGPVEELLGLPAETLVGSSAGILFAGGERAARDLALACVQGPVFEERQVLRRGRTFPAQLTLRQSELGAVALLRDLTAAPATAGASVLAHDLGRFASLVAHEVRNPLSAVKIALQTLERHGTLQPNDRRRVTIANREVGSIEALLSEVMEFARPPSLAMAPVDPVPAVRDAVASVESEWAGRGVTFRARLPERLLPLQHDPDRLRTAARILCRHSAIAADEVGGGEVAVSLRTRDDFGCVLTVEDRGHPLSPELRARAFAPFTVTRARGTGLGLAVVQRIAREHGGSVELLDGPAGGNLFSLVFAGHPG